MHLHVSNFGAFIGKKSERLVIKINGKVTEEVPFFDVEQVTIDSPGVSMSIGERDEKMRMVYEEIDPGVTETCYETCPYFAECHG